MINNSHNWFEFDIVDQLLTNATLKPVSGLARSTLGNLQHLKAMRYSSTSSQPIPSDI
jgi:hypothetical protein